jgi:hypothetical protein
MHKAASNQLHAPEPHVKIRQDLHQVGSQRIYTDTTAAPTSS